MLLLEKKDAQRVLDYLVQQPYREVHELVQILMSLKENTEPKQQIRETQQ